MTILELEFLYCIIYTFVYILDIIELVYYTNNLDIIFNHKWN